MLVPTLSRELVAQPPSAVPDSSRLLPLKRQVSCHLMKVVSVSLTWSDDADSSPSEVNFVSAQPRGRLCYHTPANA